MFGKPKDENDHPQRPAAIQSGEQVLTENDHLQRPAAVQSEGRVSTDQASFISRGMTVVGKIVGEGTVEIFGGIEGELRAAHRLDQRRRKSGGRHSRGGVDYQWTGQGDHPRKPRQAQ